MDSSPNKSALAAQHYVALLARKSNDTSRIALPSCFPFWSPMHVVPCTKICMIDLHSTPILSQFVRKRYVNYSEEDLLNCRVAS